MKERKFYTGVLNGIRGVWTDKCPKGLKEKIENVFYSADEGNVFVKDGEIFDSVVIREGVNIEDYTEIKDPRPTEEPEPEAE